jgi:hypothetical protein
MIKIIKNTYKLRHIVDYILFCFILSTFSVFSCGGRGRRGGSDTIDEGVLAFAVKFA